MRKRRRSRRDRRRRRILVCLVVCLLLLAMGLLFLRFRNGEKVHPQKEYTISEEVTLFRQDDALPVADEETDSTSDREVETTSSAETKTAPDVYNFIHADGDTLATRIWTPEGYSRVEAEEGSLQAFLRDYQMKPDGSPVLLYDGDEKWNQDAHVAVFELPIEAKDLQQCADSVMRVYAEYFWATEQYDKIQFHFTNGFLATYSKWREGYRISVDGNDVSWKKSAEYDASYETFVKYLRMVFAYAGTLSMEQESEKINISEVRAGDVILKGGSPGHVVLVVDVCENEQGEKAFLLAQGYMPAQEFHVLKNPLHEDDPWYYEEEIIGDIETPEYYFAEGSFKRLSYLD